MDPTVTDTSSEPTPPPPHPPEPDFPARIAQLERDLQQAQQTAHQAETRAHIHRALASTGAVDLDAVALVVEAALPRDAGAHDAAGVARIVEEVRRSRPALFRALGVAGGAARASTMTARVDRPRSGLEDAALHAARTGDRASLLHYLRLKRTS